MMDILKKALLSLLLIFSLSIYGADLATGQWKAHMSYVDGQRIAVSENKVYVVASGSLFSYDERDNSTETFSRTTGLSDVYINDIGYCPKTKTLVICYENGNIDLMNSDGITNIPDLEQKPIYGSKNINKVDIIDGTAYISTAFGILNLNIERAEIKETYILSTSGQNGVNGVAIYDNDIYAATDNGLFKADVDHVNLQDFSAWVKVDILGSSNSVIDGVIAFADHIIVAQVVSDRHSVKAWSNGADWREIMDIGDFRSFDADSDRFVINDYWRFFVLDTDLVSTPSIASYNFSDLEFPEQNSIRAGNAIPVGNSAIWFADQNSSLVKYSYSSPTANVAPRCPATNTIWDIDIVNSVLRSVHGKVKADWSPTITPGAISTYSEGRWSHIDTKTVIPSYPYGADLLSVATDPLDVSHYYVSNWYRGLLEFRDDELVEKIDHSNSSFVPVYGSTVWACGLIYDKNNNLWATNSYVDEKLHMLNRDEAWSDFTPNLGEHVKMTGDITFTDKDRLWVVTPYWGDGIFVYDTNNTLDDDSDDQTKYFSVNASVDGDTEFVSDDVRVIKKDHSGNLWVGCDNGVVIYYNPDDAFDSAGDPLATRISIPRNDGTGKADYLLKDEVVQSIAVDGGNRKWLATANTGVMLVSPDGQKVIHHFTKENSPLLSNSVRVVEVDHDTGEVFFGTGSGMISYQADATSGGGSFDDIKVYPNPVREDFYGDITITGLMEGTIVKITDVSGNLVNEVTSNGGTALWSGNNFYGERVATGVYLMFCSSEDGDQSAMTKVMVVN